MKLSELIKRSYVPYSGNAVAAVVQSRQGNYFPGVRVENLAFPLTISAIQNAIFCCVSEGEVPSVLFYGNQPDTDLKFWQNTYDLETHTVNNQNNFDFASILVDVSTIEETLQNLLEQASAVHSQFPVSALLETDSGFISGVNIENDHWSCGLCAERVVLGKAVSYGYTHFRALHLTTKYGEFSSPCGACRQVIIEHMPHHAVHLYHANGMCSAYFSSDLLPYSFHSLSLKKDRGARE